MVHILYPIFLYLLGVLFLRPAVPAIQLRFVGWTAFAWGALVWIVAALLVLILPVPYTAATILATISLLWLGVMFLFGRSNHRLGNVAVRENLMPFALFALVVALPPLTRVVHVLPDTFDMLLMARDIAGGHVSPATFENLGVYGPAWPLLHTAATWFDAGFIYSLPAAIAFTLVATFRFFCFEGLRRLGWAAAAAARSANLVALLFVTTFWVFNQFVYYHNGSLAALFLLLGVGGLWLALVDGEKAWLWVGTSALIGLSLARAETILFPVAFLALAVSFPRFTPNYWVGALLPFTALHLVWYGWLGFVARPDTVYLTPTRILLFAATVAGLFFGVVSLRLAPVRNLVRPRLFAAFLAGLGLAVTGLIVVFPQESVNPLWSTAVNFFLFGTLWWGVIWWLVVAAFILLVRAPRFDYQQLYSGVILSFVALYLMLGILAGGYSMYAESSGSRMGLHILPVILLYLLLRAAPYLEPETAGSVSAVGEG